MSTKLGNIRIEKEIKEKLKPLYDGETQHVFSQRQIDPIFIGAAMALHNKIPPKKIKEPQNIINIGQDIKDHDDLLFIARIIAFGHLLNEGNEKPQDIVFQPSEILRIVEELFTGAWYDESKKLERMILREMSPDLALFRELEPLLSNQKGREAD